MRVKLPTKNMEKIKKSIKEKITRMEELKITEKELGKTIMKRKSWAAPGIDGISSFWWKTLRSSWEKTSNSNADMDQGSKQSTNMANAKKDGVYTQVHRFVK